MILRRVIEHVLGQGWTAVGIRGTGWRCRIIRNERIAPLRPQVQRPRLHIYAFDDMLSRMRTTLDINDRLLAEAKSLAAQRGLSLKALVEEALRDRLLARGSGRRASVRLPTFSGHGLQSGVELTDSAALLETMDADP